MRRQRELKTLCGSGFIVGRKRRGRKSKFRISSIISAGSGIGVLPSWYLALWIVVQIVRACPKRWLGVWALDWLVCT